MRTLSTGGIAVQSRNDESIDFFASVDGPDTGPDAVLPNGQDERTDEDEKKADRARHDRASQRSAPVAFTR